MTILGIDPGTRRIGYGVVRREGLRFLLLDAGILKIRSGKDPEALHETKREMDRLFAEWNPEILAVEKLFFAKNRKTALGVAAARGVITLAGMEHGVRIEEYAPNEVKAELTGYGFADKRAVLKMVRLTLRAPALKVIDDASDALAIALVAGFRRKRA